MSALLGFAPLRWPTELAIEVYGLAYLAIAEAIRRAFRRQVAIIPHGGR